MGLFVASSERLVKNVVCVKIKKWGNSIFVVLFLKSAQISQYPP